MMAYPVHYEVTKPTRFTRLQMLVRLVASAVTSLLGFSLGLFYPVVYLVLPVYAAVRLGGRHAADYLRVDAPRVVRLLAWMGVIYAWFALVTDRLPASEDHEEVHIAVEPMGSPTMATAMARLVLGLPSAFALSCLGFVGVFVWFWSALRVFLFEEVGGSAHAYLVGVQRFSIRLLAYQASLVDVYPPFSFEDGPVSLPLTALR